MNHEAILCGSPRRPARSSLRRSARAPHAMPRRDPVKRLRNLAAVSRSGSVAVRGPSTSTRRSSPSAGVRRD